MRLAWVTDIHFNFLDRETRLAFLHSLAAKADAVAVSGDLAESRDIEPQLGEIEAALQRPVYFVLGNHDFYHGSIAKTREAVSLLAAGSPHLVYLTTAGIVELTPDTAIVGHDGWADARLGDFDNSGVILNDYVLIEELCQWDGPGVLDKQGLRQALHALGDEAAAHFERTLAEAAAKYANIIAVTHVPPFRAATWHEGKISDDDFLPHFSCRAAGEAMLRVMQSYPGSNLLVLCGHTHGSGEVSPLPNLRVLTGGAKYGSPELQQVFQIG